MEDDKLTCDNCGFFRCPNKDVRKYRVEKVSDRGVVSKWGGKLCANCRNTSFSYWKNIGYEITMNEPIDFLKIP